MKFKKGDIVIISFPFSDSKIRMVKVEVKVTTCKLDLPLKTVEYDRKFHCVKRFGHLILLWPES
jgi:hypothetical protein